MVRICSGREDSPASASEASNCGRHVERRPSASTGSRHLAEGDVHGRIERVREGPGSGTTDRKTGLELKEEADSSESVKTSQDRYIEAKNTAGGQGCLLKRCLKRLLKG